jgi:hypothetical protein
VQLKDAEGKQEELRDAFKVIEVEPMRVRKQLEVVKRAQQSMVEEVDKLKQK